MLRIYPVCLAMVREVRRLADAIARLDRDQARQLRRSSVSVVLNVAEGSGARGGTRTQRYRDALGSALETRANLEAAEAIGYVAEIEPAVLGALDHIAGTLTKLVR
jgi:four helix bundle protein